MRLTHTGTDWPAGLWHLAVDLARRASPWSPLTWAMIIALIALLLLLGAPVVSGQEIVVGPGERVTRIARALELAAPGTRVRIRAGVYREGTIVIGKPVTLLGEGWPVLDGEGKHTVLQVTADSVEIEGLVLRGAGVSMVSDNAAIRFEGTRGCRVEGNRLEDNYFGIYLAKTAGCRVARNTLRSSGTRESTSGNGIHLWNASDVQVEENEITGHRDGIYLEFASAARLSGNRSERNLRYGLHFMFSNRTIATGNTFRDNGAGVAVMYSKEVELEGNRFLDNWGAASYGLLLKEMTDSRIAGNTFRRNTVGIYSEGSGRIEVQRNQFLANGWAVRMRSNSRENRFTENNFIDNAFDVTTDSRQNFNSFAGNYWSRYDGYDLTGDGIGDVPYRPVRLFSLIVERTPAALVLMRTLFVELLDLAERVMPVLTPETLVDDQPLVREILL